MKDLPLFAVLSNQNIDPYALSSASNFIHACEDQASMAAALVLASEAPAGVLSQEFLRDQSTRVDTKVVTALASVVDLFRYEGDQNIDFYPRRKDAMFREATPRWLQAQIGKATSPTHEGKLINQLRLYPFQRYVGELATAAGDVQLAA